MSVQTFRVVDAGAITPNTRRGGELRTLLAPSTVAATSGFMGTALIRPGDWIAEHYHPYSEEFLYVVSGEAVAELDGVPHRIGPDQALMIPIDVRHRVCNTGREDLRIVFHLSPLAPRPDLGHVDTEQREQR
ncbi:cupin domain-containing protein [Streptomyces morookaense]|uniref:Cupin domain-containing protein n=1 Tax=Streptomyces morookaense TaxID=1970 RepID=A0A7Y7B134_STRMO|nr:cupin domain-containing protein [Streptomyces morookaense]NVK76962.1 cupin domain-containing protein [Streptomyces morookaense]GHF23050.1 16.7 kDa protein in whiE locus [Streptomyces morookaense]